MTTADICTHRLPEFDHRLNAAVAALSPWLEPNRGLASTSGKDKDKDVARLATVDRDIWRKWAEERLVEAQHYIDAVEGIPAGLQVREELSDIASDLVSFHGYARQGKAERMVHTLELIQAHSAKARGLACPTDQMAAGSQEAAGT